MLPRAGPIRFVYPADAIHPADLSLRNASETKPQSYCAIITAERDGYFGVAGLISDAFFSGLVNSNRAVPT